MSFLIGDFHNVKMCNFAVAVLAFVFLMAAPIVAQQTIAQSTSGESVTLESLLKKYQQPGEKKWEKTIQKLEARNVAEGAWPRESLLFYGSSSFRRWDSMANDMAPYPAINRGYGGAKFVDMVLFADRMLKPHHYRALMLFAANDVKGEAGDSSPEEVACAVREIINVSQTHQPDAPVFIVEVTPTEDRWSSWEKTRQINATLRDIALTTENTWFIATAQHYLNADVTPKKEYFIDDKLHLNEAGYKKWAGLIKSHLNRFLPAIK